MATIVIEPRAQECRVVRGLRLLHFVDCVYLIHVANLWRYLEYTSKPGSLPEFVILTKTSARVRVVPVGMTFCA